MGLQATVLKAVQTVVRILDDLAIPGTHLERTPTTYTPGGPVIYGPPVTHDVKVVITSFTEREIEEDRSRASDVKLIVFHETAIPKLNDTITVKNVARAGAVPTTIQFRVMRGVPTYAGSEIAFSTVQARPLSA